MAVSAPQPLVIGFVEGATPDKWARTWRERRPEPLELMPLAASEQDEALRSRRVAMALVRLPVDRDGVHCIPLYEERPVVVAGREHLVVAAAGPDDEVTLADLADEQLVRPLDPGHGPEWADWRPAAEQLAWPPMSAAEAVETVAAGTGVVVLPMALARLHARRDVVTRPVADLPGTRVGLAWLVEDDDDPLRQEFIGIVRGRTARSSRG
ncbi:LysR family transcriptional regulator [Nocardioides sp. TRM66260-LWL]|uniref:LysR substrate-binding domain-containing protein n=1 Tax=Nocardioides sp. TRM66260-LWL TaxID=2874478 RepID=UPI001CC6C5CF|nr:LysR substrate-binding domain-containing protein [Nocardioides sp. TRM66260-LWL]MBZ5733946.1 LysR family transcriptional regulator [Nocardioides sp. TRM66260-LWL]